MNANLEQLAKIHGKDKAESVFREIADLGGFGSVGNGEGSISPDYAGGLDVRGVLSSENTAVSEKAKNRIAELAGVDRKDAEPDAPTTSSAGKMRSKENK